MSSPEPHTAEAEADGEATPGRARRPRGKGETRIGIAALLSFLILVSVMVANRDRLRGGKTPPTASIHPATSQSKLRKPDKPAASSNANANANANATAPEPNAKSGETSAPVDPLLLASNDHPAKDEVVAPVPQSPQPEPTPAPPTTLEPSKPEPTPAPIPEPAPAPAPANTREPSPLEPATATPTAPEPAPSNTPEPPKPEPTPTPILVPEPAPMPSESVVAVPAAAPEAIQPAPATDPSPFPQIPEPAPNPVATAPAMVPAVSGVVATAPGSAPSAPPATPPPVPMQPATTEPAAPSAAATRDIPNLTPAPGGEPAAKSALTPPRDTSSWIALPNLGKRRLVEDDDRLTLDPEPSPGGEAFRPVPERIVTASSTTTTARPVPADPAPVEPVSHVVQRGENFWTISRQYYGWGRFWRALWAANRATVPAPEKLYVGQTIRVPAPEALERSLIEPERPVRQAAPTSAQGEVAVELPTSDPFARRPVDDMPKPAEDGTAANAPTARPMRYKVQPYETLRSIARDLLGDPRRAAEILELNARKIDDPVHLTPGQVITLPPDAEVGFASARRTR